MAQGLLDKVGLQATQVDIALDEQLFSRYAVTIPVVAYQTSELHWPFDLQELIEWLHNNGINYHP